MIANILGCRVWGGQQSEPDVEVGMERGAVGWYVVPRRWMGEVGAYGEGAFESGENRRNG